MAEISEGPDIQYEIFISSMEKVHYCSLWIFYFTYSHFDSHNSNLCPVKFPMKIRGYYCNKLLHVYPISYLQSGMVRCQSLITAYIIYSFVKSHMVK